MAANDVQTAYYNLIKQNLNKLAYVRSRSVINSALVEVFRKFYDPFSRRDRVTGVQSLVVQNDEFFGRIIHEATEKFRRELMNDTKRKPEHYDFFIQESKGYSLETHLPLVYEKSLYQPLFVLITDSATGHINQLEKDFLDYLEDRDEVKWFWENGTEVMKENFGIPYNSGMNTFQPDFIVKFVDGRVGIFDTKASGQNVEDTTVKAEALYRFIKDTNHNRGNLPRLVGGIVMQKGSQFRVYNEAEYHDIAEDERGWAYFSGLLDEVMFNKEQQEELKASRIRSKG